MLTYKDLLLTGPEAVCIMNANLEIKQHNQFLSFLLGYRNGKLIGRHLSGILYDDLLIRNLLSSDTENDWFQGECTLKTNGNRPLEVKFRAGQVIEKDPLFTYPEMMDIIYYPSESRFLPSPSYSSGEAEDKGYVLVFRETDEAQHIAYERRIRALRFLLSVVSQRDMELEDILSDFVKTFDRHAEVTLLSPDSLEGESGSVELQLPLPQPAVEALLRAMEQKIVSSYHDEDLWYFLPVYSSSKVYGVACVKFAVPRVYREEDKRIFNLAGKVLGIYTETFTSGGQGLATQSLLDTILDGTDHPIIVVDRNGVITLCNLAAQRTYGYAASDMLGKSFGDLAFPAASPIGYEELLSKLAEDRLIQEEEMTHVRSDLSMVDVSFSAYPYKLADGLIAGAIFMIRDLSERRRLWSKMIHWEKLSALGETLSSVANELNNPLTSLAGYSHLLLHRDSDEEIDDMVSIIYEEAKRCGNIVRGILDLAREDEMRKGYSYVNDIIIAALDLKRRQLRPNNIDVCMNLGEGIPRTTADAHDIERLFLRIINYAEHRMVEYDNGGRLTVESALEDGNIVIRFIDTGTCVLKDEVAEISDPFFTPAEDEGVGLGLSISCQILRDMGGNIRIENEMGKGNVFTVELPAEGETSSDTVEHPAENASHAPESGKRIMVVDDEPTILDLVAEILQQMGHVADIARDGNEAMKRLDVGNYDLIIADLRMPSGFTGDRLYKFIELRDPELAQRIIFITGDVINPETRKFLQSTGNLYLEKPFTPGSLQKAIRKLLNKQETAE